MQEATPLRSIDGHYFCLNSVGDVCITVGPEDATLIHKMSREKNATIYAAGAAYVRHKPLFTIQNAMDRVWPDTPLHRLHEQQLPPIFAHQEIHAVDYGAYSAHGVARVMYHQKAIPLPLLQKSRINQHTPLLIPLRLLTGVNVSPGVDTPMFLPPLRAEKVPDEDGEMAYKDLPTDPKVLWPDLEMLEREAVLSYWSALLRGLPVFGPPSPLQTKGYKRPTVPPRTQFLYSFRARSPEFFLWLREQDMRHVRLLNIYDDLWHWTPSGSDERDHPWHSDWRQLPSIRQTPLKYPRMSSLVFDRLNPDRPRRINVGMVDGDYLAMWVETGSVAPTP